VDRCIDVLFVLFAACLKRVEWCWWCRESEEEAAAAAAAAAAAQAEADSKGREAILSSRYLE
jgi:hypothetical protein